MYDIIASDDAQLLYQGEASIHSYGRSNTNKQFFVLNSLDEEQFDVVMRDTPANTPIILHGGIGEDVYIDNWSLVLKRVGDGKKTGPIFRIEFPLLDDEAYTLIKDLSKQPLFITMFQGEFVVKKKQKKGPHGTFARQLIQSRLWRMPGFWVVVGSEQDYFSWLRQQKCCVTGSFYKVTETGEEKCEVSHVKSVRFGSGTAEKPPYFAVPMHPDIHRFNQHQNGIVSVWEKAGRTVPKKMAYPIGSPTDIARFWLESKALRYVGEWCKEKIKIDLGLSSLSFLSPEDFTKYLTSRGAGDMVRFV